MAYKTTITFPVRNISPTETIQLILEFNTDLTGSDRVWDAANYNLRVLNYGSRSMSYDMEDPFIVPTKVSHLIGDPDNIIGDGLLFGVGAIAQATDKRGTVTVKVNGVIEFVGNMLEDTISFDEGTKSLEYTAAPKIDLINKQSLYDNAGTALNPFGKTEGGAVRQTIKEILEDVYGIIDSSISYPSTLLIDHLWKFRGQRTDYFGNFLEDMIVPELSVTTDQYYFDNTFDLKTCGDLLRLLALDFGAFTGMLNNGKAFFKKLFYYDPTNTQAVTVYSHKKNYMYGALDYVQIINYYEESVLYEKPNHAAYTEEEGRFLKRKLLSAQTYNEDIPPTWDGNLFANCARANTWAFITGNTITIMPVVGDTYTNNGSTFRVTATQVYDATWGNGSITAERTAGTNDPTAGGTLTRATGSGDATITFTSAESLATEAPYRIMGSKDDDLLSGAWQPKHCNLVSEFWWHWRGNINYCRVDKFLLKGISYDFLKSFNYNGCKYQPIQMRWNDADGITECEAIYLGEL